MTLHCLHGFLGSPRDWDEFGAASIPAWAEAYCRRVAQARALVPATGRHYLLGYSLGGRLALHMAVQFPALWDGMVIVGANPGLDSAEARGQRRRNDETWARRFEAEPWETVLAAWDAQPVFAGRRAALGERREDDFSRARLADALRRWSLGAQAPLWLALRTLPCPVLWVAGAEDAGQVPICRRVRATIPQVETWVAPDAGHRVPWEQPQAFTARVAEFLTAAQRRRLDGGKK